MKLLEINNLYHGAGAENVMKMLGDSFEGLGHEVWYLTTEVRDHPRHIQITSLQQKLFSHLSKKQKHGGISKPLDGIAKRLTLKLKKYIPLRNTLINWKFDSILRELRPDIIHIHNLQPFGVGILEIAKKHKIPTYITLHGYWPICPSSLLYTQNERKICSESTWDNCRLHCNTLDISSVMKKQKEIIESSVTKIIAVSDYVRERLIEFGYNKDLIQTIHNGVDTEKFRPIQSPQRNYYLHVGRLSDIKGSLVVLDAAKHLPHERFIFIGSKKPSEEAVPQNVEFIEWIRSEELITYYQNAKAIIAPSLWPEPHSLVPLEVMSCGTPIIATPFGGNKESIGENCSFLIEDATELKDFLITYDATNNETLGIQARKRILDMFDLTRMREDYKNLFGL